MDIKKYIGEATEYDKKQEVEHRKVKSWLKSVSAFANGAGGCLIFGVSNVDRIIGLADAKADAEFVSQKVKERIAPVPQTVMRNDTQGDTRGTQNGTQNGTRGTRNVPRDVSQGGLRGEDLDEWIAYQLAVHPKMTTEELSSLSGRGIRTIKRHITGMQRLKFVGRGTNGYWLVGPKVDTPKPKKDNQASGQVSDQAGDQVSGQAGGQVGGQVGGLLNETIKKMLLLIGRNYLSIFDIQKAANIASRRYVREKMLVPAIEQGLVLMEHPDSPRHPKQRYYLSEKGLKLTEKE